MLLWPTNELNIALVPWTNIEFCCTRVKGEGRTCRSLEYTM